MKRAIALFLAALMAVSLMTISLADDTSDTLIGMMEELIEPSKSESTRSEYLPSLYWAYMYYSAYSGLKSASSAVRKYIGDDLAIEMEKSNIELPMIATNSYKAYLNGENDGSELISLIELYCQSYRVTHSK